MLLCLLAHSQEAESTGSGAELTIIPNLELVPSYSTPDKAFGFGLGNSSIYTLFEGSASEHFSWTVANHWLSLSDTDDLGWLYRGTGYSDTTNWLDYFKADLTFGNWTFTLGKDMILTGGFEFDEWDWDLPANLTTPLWNYLPTYQWGASVAYTLPSECSTFLAQISTSPAGLHPFSSGLKQFSAMWKSEFGWLSTIWSASALEVEKGAYNWLFVLGQRGTFGDWSVTLDYTNMAASEDFNHTVHATVANSPSDKLDWAAKFIWCPTGWIAGAHMDWFPLKESRDLRLRAALSYDKFLEGLALNIGVCYNLRFRLW